MSAGPDDGCRKGLLGTLELTLSKVESTSASTSDGLDCCCDALVSNCSDDVASVSMLLVREPRAAAGAVAGAVARKLAALRNGGGGTLAVADAVLEVLDLLAGAATGAAGTGVVTGVVVCCFSWPLATAASNLTCSSVL